MTVIAWDGKTLAADKMLGGGGLRRKVSKVFKMKNGDAVAGCGNYESLCALVEWYRSGADPKNMPKNVIGNSGEEESETDLIVAKRGYSGLFVYGRYPVPMYLEDTYQAHGTGAHFALAAMKFGKTARQAVEFTCLHETSCGLGVDSVVVNGPNKPKKKKK